ncbi:MAG: C4-type zinc ribbon domain-containing protein [Chthoniobacterales bacterium]
MFGILEKLLLLQERDQKLQAFLHEINGVPGEKAALQRELDTAQRTLENDKGRATQIEVERKRLEVEADGKRTQIAKYRTQQFETRKNEEYAALKHEIERAESDISTIEDRELDLMQELEDLKPAIASAEQKYATEKVRVSTLMKNADDKVGVLQGRADELRVERDAIAAEVRASDEDLLDLYEKLFRTKMGRAVVPLEGNHCSGCHMTVTPATLRDARVGASVVSCEQCGRIVYAMPE